MSMLHDDEGALQAYLDDELSAPERAEVERHLAECAACATAIGSLGRQNALVANALAAADRPAPATTSAQLRRRALQRGWQRQARRALPYAAMLVLGTVGYASATLPGSPVHGWPESIWRDVASLFDPPAQRAAAPTAEPPMARPPATSAAAPRQTPREMGVSIAPVDGAVRIEITRPAQRLVVRAALSTEPNADVVARSEAATAQFESRPGYIGITGAGAGELHLSLPAAARSIRVEVDGVLYITKEQGQLRIHTPAASNAAEVSFTVRP